mmetsp:Transcript_35237/g.75219  ORF Transcript_35237/g.75219 Transcript_35237/m.75219 type:complete len:437 (-) Transcript_35237:49-1359(-)
MREEIDVVPTLEGCVASMQRLRRLVVHNIARLHHNFMQTICMVVDLNSPRFRNILLGNVDDQTCRMGRLPIHVRQKTRPLCVLPHPIHVRRLKLHPCPRLNQLPQPALPAPLEVPRDLYEVHVRLPIVYEHSLVPPPLLMDLVWGVSIVVVVGSQARKHIVREAALVETQCAEGAFDPKVSSPLAHGGALYLVLNTIPRHVWLDMILDPHYAVAGHVNFEHHFVCQWIIIRLGVVYLKFMADEGGDKGRFALAVGQVLVGNCLPSPAVDPVDLHGVLMVIDEAVLHLAARVARQKPIHVLHLPDLSLILDLPALPVSMREGPGDHAPLGALLEARRQTVPEGFHVRGRRCGVHSLKVAEDGAKGFPVQGHEFVSPLPFADGGVGIDEGGTFSGGVGEDVRGEAIILIVGEIGQEFYGGRRLNFIMGQYGEEREKQC